MSRALTKHHNHRTSVCLSRETQSVFRNPNYLAIRALDEAISTGIPITVAVRCELQVCEDSGPSLQVFTVLEVRVCEV